MFYVILIATHLNYQVIKFMLGVDLIITKEEWRFNGNNVAADSNPSD